MSVMSREFHSEYRQGNLLVKPVAGRLGAEIEGINLRSIDPSDEELVASIRQLMLRHRVVFFRQQHLSADEHQQFASLFGEITTAHPFLPGKTGHPNIFEIDYTLPGVQYPRYEDGDDVKYQERGVSWHTDVTFMEVPPSISILNGVKVPYAGGDTMWSDMVGAFKALSKPMKDALRGCMAIHDGTEVQMVVTGQANVDTVGCFMTGAKPPSKTRKELGEDVTKLIQSGGPAVLKAKHPVVIVHPETGEEALFIHQGFTRRIVDFSKPESDALLKFLFDWCTRYEFTVRHRWTEGDIALADNRVTQHAVVGDIGRSERLINRVTIRGEKPVGVPKVTAPGMTFI